MTVKQYRWALVAVAAVSPAAAALLFFVDPSSTSGIYPPCLLYATTGLHCPFCGTTRCGHSLLHGDILQALAWNPISVVLLPVATLWLFWAAVRVIRSRPLPYVNPPNWSLRVFLTGIILFAIVRNLPFFPFDLLAPHKL
jgi:hypothetical protein